VARYRHTSTIVPAGSSRTKDDLLVVFGGIGVNGEVLADVNILDLGSMAWSTLDAPMGDKPSPGN